MISISGYLASEDDVYIDHIFSMGDTRICYYLKSTLASCQTREKYSFRYILLIALGRLSSWNISGRYEFPNTTLITSYGHSQHYHLLTLIKVLLLDISSQSILLVFLASLCIYPWTSPIAPFALTEFKHSYNKSSVSCQYSSLLCKINLNAPHRTLLSTLVLGLHRQLTMDVPQSPRTAPDMNRAQNEPIRTITQKTSLACSVA